MDEKNIFLFGTSQGGAVSTITAAKHQKEIRGLILFKRTGNQFGKKELLRRIGVIFLFLFPDQIAYIRTFAGKHFIIKILFPVNISNTVL